MPNPQGYRLNRQYVRELVHVLDGKRVFDPKMPIEHDATMFAKHSELTSTMLQDMVSDAHVPSDRMQELTLLSGAGSVRCVPACAHVCTRACASVLLRLALRHITMRPLGTLRCAKHIAGPAGRQSSSRICL